MPTVEEWPRVPHERSDQASVDARRQYEAPARSIDQFYSGARGGDLVAEKGCWGRSRGFSPEKASDRKLYTITSGGDTRAYRRSKFSTEPAISADPIAIVQKSKTLSRAIKVYGLTKP